MGLQESLATGILQVERKWQVRAVWPPSISPRMQGPYDLILIPPALMDDRETARAAKNGLLVPEGD